MLHSTLAIAIALLIPASTPTSSAPGIRPAAGIHPVAATIQGKITTKVTPPRRIANRYVGAASPSTQQDLPIVVYLRGGSLPAAKPSARNLQMAQRDTAFSPSFLIVARGSTVAFQNLDPFYHNVFSYSKTKRFDLGRFPRPESKSVTFDKPGAVDVFCEIHRSMRGVVLVAENEFHAEVAADGSYALRGVPPGKYELVVWHADRGQKVIPITVPAEGVLTVNSSF
jgi:plastocyanin